MSIDTLPQWFETPLGKYLLAQEQAYHDEAVADIFGFHAMQIGLAEFDFLRASRIPLRFATGASGPVKLRASCDELPIATQSIDLLVIPHLLEFADNPYQILREIDRVMMPEGRIIITGFNPWSMWGMRRVLGFSERERPWNGNFISLLRLKDWLALLNFDVSAGRLCCYAPPCDREQWLNRFRFMEQAGDRWWGVAGGVYMLQAIKRVARIRLIMPGWNARMSAEQNLAPAQRAAGVRREARSSHLRQVK